MATGSRLAIRPCCCCSTARACASPKLSASGAPMRRAASVTCCASRVRATRSAWCRCCPSSRRESALHRGLPVSARAGRPAFRRRQGRSALAAHHPARDRALAGFARTAGYGDAACVAAFVRDAPFVGRGRPASDPGAPRPCLAVDDAGVHGSRSRAPARGL